MGRIESRDVAAFDVVSPPHFVERRHAAYTGYRKKGDNYGQKVYRDFQHPGCFIQAKGEGSQMAAVKAILSRLEKSSIGIYTAREALCDTKAAIRRYNDS